MAVLLVLPLMGGCISDAAPEGTPRGPSMCWIDELVIHEYGDYRMDRTSVAASVDTLKRLFPDLTVRYQTQPASSGDTIVIPPADAPTSLRILYLDVDSPHGSWGLSEGGLVLLWPRTMQEAYLQGLPSGDGPLPAQPPQWTTIWQYVLTHEVGHELGLINTGLDASASREDPDDRSHSTEPHSVMHTGFPTQHYYTGDGIPLDFSPADWRDLEAAQAPGGTCNP